MLMNYFQFSFKVMIITIHIFNSVYNDEGDPAHPCQFCGALLWHNERIERYKGISDIQFAICCSKGKNQSPKF